jgi:cell division septation protein DedD
LAAPGDTGDNASVNIRNLEQIQEDEVARRPSRLGTLLLASVGGAALVIVGVMMSGRDAPAARSSNDPLADLVAQTKRGTPPEQLDGRDVTFPAMLSDDRNPTTALAAVKDERGRLVKQPDDVLAPSVPTVPPPANDRLPVMPLPAGSLLNATAITTAPKDALTALTAAARTEPAAEDIAPGGSDGGFQLQVASFKEGADAEAFVQELRRRGHRAYSQAAYVADRGLWHRVRVGPFKTKFEANQYKAKFERSERVAPFVIDPSKVKQDEEMRVKRVSAAR